MSKFFLYLFLAGLVLYFVFDNVSKKNSWTLMVCKSLMDDGTQCYENSYEIPGLKSQSECMLAGLSLPEKTGFECGKGCRKTDYGMYVCTPICGKSGCRY